MDTIKLNTIKIFTLFSGYDSQLMGIINAVKNSKKHFDVELVGCIIRKTIFSAIPKRNEQNSEPKRKTKWSWKHQTLNTKSSIEKPRKICIFRGFFVCKKLLNSRIFRTFASVKLMLCVLIH